MTAVSVERTLGLILGKLDSFEKTMNKADESRARLYSKLDAMENKITETEEAVRDTAKRLGAIEPTVADISKWRERGIGAILLVSFVAASLGGLLTAFGKKLWAALSG